MNNTFRSKKLDKLVKTGRQLFMRHGIRRITVEEICREAHVSKMTFYKYFDNKIDIAKRILHAISDEAISDYSQIMALEVPFAKKVRKLIQLKRQQTEILSQEFLQDIMKNPDPEIAIVLQEIYKKNLELIFRDFQIAQDRGEIRQDLNVNFILYFMNHMIEMSKDEKLINLYDSTTDLIVELTNFFFYGISPVRDEEPKNV